MQATSEIEALNYFFSDSNSSLFIPTSTNFLTVHHQNGLSPAFQLQSLTNQIHGGGFFQNLPHAVQDSTSTSCISSNSTSDEADEQQRSLINERKHRRMISNRESARRSRMRKQKHLDELWSQVVWLRNENHHLVSRLNNVSESHDKVVRENAQLKEEASELRQMITEMKMQSPLVCAPLSPFEDLHCGSEFLRSADSSNQSAGSSVDSMDQLLG